MQRFDAPDPNPGCSIIQCDTKESDTLEIQVAPARMGLFRKNRWMARVR